MWPLGLSLPISGLAELSQTQFILRCETIESSDVCPDHPSIPQRFLRRFYFIISALKGHRCRLETLVEAVKDAASGSEVQIRLIDSTEMLPLWRQKYEDSAFVAESFLI